MNNYPSLVRTDSGQITQRMPKEVSKIILIHMILAMQFTVFTVKATEISCDDEINMHGMHIFFSLIKKRLCLMFYDIAVV